MSEISGAHFTKKNLASLETSQQILLFYIALYKLASFLSFSEMSPSIGLWNVLSSIWCQAISQTTEENRAVQKYEYALGVGGVVDMSSPFATKKHMKGGVTPQNCIFIFLNGPIAVAVLVGRQIITIALRILKQ